MNKNLLTKLKHKKEAYKMLKEGQMTLKNAETLTEPAEKGLGNPKPIWS